MANDNDNDNLTAPAVDTGGTCTGCGCPLDHGHHENCDPTIPPFDGRMPERQIKERLFPS